MSLYTELVEAGLEISHWQSDLYVEVNATSKEILSRHALELSNAKIFRSEVDGKMLYDVPFAYEPYWERLPK